MQTCLNCSHENGDDCRYCVRCGASLNPREYFDSMAQEQQNQEQRQPQPDPIQIEILRSQLATERATKNIFALLFIIFVCPLACIALYYGSAFGLFAAFLKLIGINF